MMQIIMRYNRNFVLFGLIVALTMGAGGFSPHAIDPHTLWVDDDDATCGGFSPCYRTIQEAVAAAQSGDTIKVHPGTYYGPILITKSLTLSGESRENVIVHNSEPGQIVVSISGPSAVNIENISIVGISPSTEVLVTAGVVISGQDPRVIISRIRLSEHIIAISLTAGEPYIGPPSSGQLIVLDSEISKNWDGIFIVTDGSYAQRIEGNQLLNNGIAITTSGRGSITIGKNRITTESQTGIGMRIEGVVEATVRENVIQNYGTGVEMRDSAQGSLEDNQITDNARNGVIVRDAARVTLVRNQIISNGLKSNALVSFPSFFYDPFFGFSGQEFNPQGFGVAVGGTATVELVENRIEGNLFGLGATQSLDPTSKQVVTARMNAQKNQIVGNGWGVWLRGAEAKLTDNEIARNNDVSALDIDPNLLFFLDLLFPASGVLVQAGQPLLQANRIMQNGLGVVLQGQASPTLIRNQILGSADYGIALYRRPCFDQITSELAFQGKVLGENNELLGNRRGDLCPADYPLPPGFRK